MPKKEFIDAENSEIKLDAENQTDEPKQWEMKELMSDGNSIENHIVHIHVFMYGFRLSIQFISANQLHAISFIEVTHLYTFHNSPVVM